MSARHRVYVTRRNIPSNGIRLLEEHFSVKQWTGESHPTREDTLVGLSGADAVFCCRVDKIDAEFLDAAGQVHVYVNIW